MRVLRDLQILLVGGITIALLSACGQTASSTGTLSQRSPTVENSAELEDPLDVLFSSIVQVNFRSGTSQSGQLVVVPDNEMQTSQPGETLGWSLNDETLRLQIGDSEPTPINPAEVDSIEPTGDVWRESNGNPARFRGSDDGVPERWNVPMQQFYLNPDNDSAAIQGVDDLFTPGQQQAIAAQLQAVWDQHGIDQGYIVSEIRFLPDSNIEVSVEAVELSE